MISKRIITILFAVLLIEISSPVYAGAAVDGSPHDLLSQGYVLKGDGRAPDKCLLCHLPTGGVGKSLVTKVPPAVSYYSKSGMVCYSCHDGTTIVSQDVDASQSAFHPDAHTLRLGALTIQNLEDARQDLPIREKSLECVTCHNPHDNATRPFIRIDIEKLCSTCHIRLDNVGYGLGNISGNHPIHETIEDDSGKITPIRPLPQFTVPFPLEYPLSGGRVMIGSHWKRGGHLRAGDQGTLECITCHNVHGGENTPPLENLLTIPPVRKTADEFCEGCHQGQRGDGRNSTLYPNPGGTVTGRTYHPCDDDISNGAGQLIRIRENVTWPFGGGAPGTLICTSCHTAHGGMEGTPALRRPVSTTTFCEECHLQELMPAHHPSGVGSAEERQCPLPLDDFNVGEKAEGEIFCSSCHVTHNAGVGKVEKNYIPILRFTPEDDDICFECHHEDNITCINQDEGTASHFMGDPTLPETYDNPNPPMRREKWPETNMSSDYGGKKENSIICRSCHVFKKPGESNMGQPLNNYLIASSGDEYEWDDDTGFYLCTGCHGDNPGGEDGGHSHPLMDADVSTLQTDPVAPATYTISGHLNCDSCHRAHGAVTEGGYYILEAVDGDNKDPRAIKPSISFTALCHLCHNPEDY